MAHRKQRTERITWVDWVMVALAIVSLGLLIIEEAYGDRLGVEASQRIIWADLAIVAVFAIEFLVRLWPQDQKWAYTKSRWYDILGMVPVSHPMFRGFRLFRLLRIVVIGSRFVRATNRTFGEATFEVLLGRFRDILVEEITDAVILNSLDTLEAPLTRARYAARIGDTLEGHRDHIHDLVQENIQATPGLSTLQRIPSTRRMIDQVEEVVFDTVVRTLRSDELNEVVGESVRSVLEELRVEVAQREWRAGRDPTTQTPDGAALDPPAAGS